MRARDEGQGDCEEVREGWWGRGLGECGGGEEEDEEKEEVHCWSWRLAEKGRRGALKMSSFSGGQRFRIHQTDSFLKQSQQLYLGGCYLHAS